MSLTCSLCQRKSCHLFVKGLILRTTPEPEYTMPKSGRGPFGTISKRTERASPALWHSILWQRAGEALSVLLDMVGQSGKSRRESFTAACVKSACNKNHGEKGIDCL